MIHEWNGEGQNFNLANKTLGKKSGHCGLSITMKCQYKIELENFLQNCNFIK
jgi:hypothetical protein